MMTVSETTGGSYMTTPGETLPEIIGNYAVMAIAKACMYEKGNIERWIEVVERMIDMRLHITERMLSEDVDTVDANGVVATLKPCERVSSGWLVEIAQNGGTI